MWILGPIVALMIEDVQPRYAPEPVDAPSVVHDAWFHAQCADPHGIITPANAWRISQYNGDQYVISRTPQLAITGLFVCSDKTIRTSDGVDIRTQSPAPTKPWRPGCHLTGATEQDALDWLKCRHGS